MKIIAANWKMHKTPTEAKSFFAQWKEVVPSAPQGTEFWFFLPAINLESSAVALANSDNKFGLQNFFAEKQGAFTGENSAYVSQQLGAQLALVGHSERRTLFSETDSECAKKIRYAQNLGLIPLLCVGETLEQREKKLTESILMRQLDGGLEGAARDKKLAIAYEPVWAIGTGKVANVDQIAHAHGFISAYLDRLGFEQTPILYGGSVKPENAAQIGAIANVHGFLVGGASLEVGSFKAIAGL